MSKISQNIDNSNSELTQAQLEAMIERYFNCELDDEGERRLRRELAATQCSSPAIDEARFTMGFLSMGMKQAHERKQQAPAVRRRKPLWRIAAVAAIVVVAALAGVELYNARTATGADECYAYVNGRRVTDDKVVMDMVKHDLDDIDRASASIDDNMTQQLQSMGQALDADEN